MFAGLKNFIKFAPLVNARTVRQGSNTLRKEVQIEPISKFLVRAGVENIGFLFGLIQSNHTYNANCLDRANAPLGGKKSLFLFIGDFFFFSLFFLFVLRLLFLSFLSSSFEDGNTLTINNN